MRPQLFTDDEIQLWESRYQGCQGTGSASQYDQRRAIHNVFKSIRALRAAGHPKRVNDALLILVGSKGQTAPHFADIFDNFHTSADYPRGGNGLDIDAEAPAYDTPENRRLLHMILDGLKAMPTSYAASAGVRFFRGTGKQGKLKHPSVGLLSSANGWKGKETEAVIWAFFDTSTSYTSGTSSYFGPICEMFTIFSDRTREYPDHDMFEAAYEKGGDPFAFVHSQRNKEFLTLLMNHLETRGLGAELTGLAKPSAKLHNDDCLKAVKAKVKAEWGTLRPILGGYRPRKAEDIYLSVSKKVKDDQGRVVRQFTGTFGAIVVVDATEQIITQVEILDPSKIQTFQDIGKGDLKDSTQPWLHLCLGHANAAPPPSKALSIDQIRDAIGAEKEKMTREENQRIWKANRVCPYVPKGWKQVAKVKSPIGVFRSFEAKLSDWEKRDGKYKPMGAIVHLDDNEMKILKVMFSMDPLDKDGLNKINSPEAAAMIAQAQAALNATPRKRPDPKPLKSAQAPDGSKLKTADCRTAIVNTTGVGKAADWKRTKKVKDDKGNTLRSFSNGSQGAVVISDPSDLIIREAILLQTELTDTDMLKDSGRPWAVLATVSQAAGLQQIDAALAGGTPEGEVHLHAAVSADPKSRFVDLDEWAEELEPNEPRYKSTEEFVYAMGPGVMGDDDGFTICITPKWFFDKYGCVDDRSMASSFAEDHGFMELSESEFEFTGTKQEARDKLGSLGIKEHPPLVEFLNRSA